MSLPNKKLSSKIKRIESLFRSMGAQGDYICERFSHVKNPKKKYRLYKKAFLVLKEEAEIASRYKEVPVDIETFIKSPDYLDHSDIVYPKVLEELKELNSGKYIEAVLTGGIGTGKTFIALTTMAYQLYVLSCLHNPQKEFGLSPNDEIVIIFQSLNASHAKNVDYMRFKHMIMNSKYFKENFFYNTKISSELQFDNRIIVRPVTGSSSAAIGQNVIGGVIDEINFMRIVKDSKNSKNGEDFNQAWEVYRSIVNRRQSRFMKQGSLPGMLCLVSSKQFPGEFTDVKIEEASTNKRIFVYDKRVWEVKDENLFSGKWFHLFIGDETRKPKIILRSELIEYEPHMIMRVPEEFKQSFEADILSALREIGGVSTRALNPFIIDIEKVSKCFGKFKSILSRDDCDFVTSTVQIIRKNIVNTAVERFIHIDLSKSGDSTGIACGYVSHFTAVKRGDENEIMPVINIDFILQVKPPLNGEIEFSSIRELLYVLRDIGLNIKWITFDTFQSVDMMQILRQKKFITGTQSMDTSTHPYELTKAAFMDGRINCPMHEHCYKEFIGLEKNSIKNMIDHRPTGSKDCSDAVAGVVYGLTLRREIWVKHRIPIQAIPQSVKSAEVTNNKGIAAEEKKFLTVGVQ